jgi:cation diffusion facilitator CzcD-associated flavoprotein CzcO
MRSGAVAILGGGPAGLVAAKYLAARGFEPVLFEQSDDLGGQWNVRSPASGVWPAMRTNTSRVLTRFSDLDYPPGTAVYPTNGEVHAYLRRYAERFGLDRCVRFGRRVELLERDPSGTAWLVRSSRAGAEEIETIPFVGVATGRFVRPSIPDVPGLASFAGAGGVAHSFHYKDPERYRDMRVLVAGSAISSLEIAADLAMLGAARVVSSYRRQRYVLPKLAAGVPTDRSCHTYRSGSVAFRAPAIGSHRTKTLPST